MKLQLLRPSHPPMRAFRFVWIALLAAVPVCRLAAQSTTCNNSSLSKTYALSMGSRTVASGVFSAAELDVGSAAFDGKGNVTINLTSDSNTQSNQTATTQGTYNLTSNCTGTLTTPSANFNIIVWAGNDAFTMSGGDSGAVITAGGSTAPGACILSTLSGPFTMNGTGYSLSGTSITGGIDVTALFQFDGMGNLNATWSVSNGATQSTVNATGQYSLGSNCQGAATLNDSTDMVSYVFAYTLYGGTNTFDVIASSPSEIFSGTGHATIVNPGQAVVNAGSFQANDSAPGAIFSIFGVNFATSALQATAVPLPDTLGTASVTVNGESAPLFYAGPGQINAQIPTDIAPGLATVIVTNGTQSNAVAVNVPGVSPGIVVYGSNHAVVQNQDGSTNAENNPAHVGDTLVVYFVGGGPVSVAGALQTGDAAPNTVAPITNGHSITVNGVGSPKVSYMGLTPGFVGLYQANFVVPQVAAGDQPLYIFINGQRSNSPAPVITIAD